MVHHTDRSPAEPLLSLVMRLQGHGGDYRMAAPASALAAAPDTEAFAGETPA